MYVQITIGVRVFKNSLEFEFEQPSQMIQVIRQAQCFPTSKKPNFDLIILFSISE